MILSHKIRNFILPPEKPAARRSCHPVPPQPSWVLLVKLIKVSSEQEIFLKVLTLGTKSTLIGRTVAVMVHLPSCLCPSQILSLPVTRKASFYRMHRIQG